MVDEGRIDWDDKELREIFRSILMTTCDIGAITKPWDVSRKVGIHIYVSDNGLSNHPLNKRRPLQ